MLLPQGLSKTCTLLAVLYGKILDRKEDEAKNYVSYPFPKLTSSGRLEVHTLVNPSFDKFQEVQKSVGASFVYFQGEQLENEEGIWSDACLSDPTMFCELLGSSLPTTVYLEVPNSEKYAETLHSKGIAYVIYWKNEFSSYIVSHFRHALLSVIQSSCCHTWDAFKVAHASFKLYCAQDFFLPVSNQKFDGKIGPCLLGDTPKFVIAPPEKISGEEEDDGDISDDFHAIKVYDDDVDMKFLICGLPCMLEARLPGPMEDGLNALLNVEIRGSKLHSRVSTTPPPLEAGTVSRGVITMRCELTTCSSAHISLLVSGSAQTCFNDQLLENHIKKELIENSRLVHVLPCCEGNKQLYEPRKSSSVACGSSVFEARMKVPTWAAQVLKQLALEISYRSLVSLGVASIQGSSVASFEKEDVQRLLFFCTRQQEIGAQDSIPCSLPVWFKSPAPTKKRSKLDREPKSRPHCGLDGKTGGSDFEVAKCSLKVAAMKPVPHVRQHKMLLFLGMHDVPTGSLTRPRLPTVPSTRHTPPVPVIHKKAASNAFHAQQKVSLNPPPLKKHGCNRCPIQVCAEEEFLRDVMEFLILRGHSRLVPQGGVSEFPEAILNAKRLDLYNLYKEVVTRGGFHVGNGINWKGQVFSKMRNHTITNRMTGVGNTLKRHYETYLLEYELAHDDVDGECCLLCRSSAPGDWVNCGLCGEWAHFGCDRRQGLGAFKDYAKTDGLEYVCPHCSLTNNKTKSSKLMNGFQQGAAASRLV